MNETKLVPYYCFYRRETGLSSALSALLLFSDELAQSSGRSKRSRVLDADADGELVKCCACKCGE